MGYALAHIADDSAIAGVRREPAVEILQGSSPTGAAAADVMYGDTPLSDPDVQEVEMQIYNGVPSDRLPKVLWSKSSWSNPDGNCVEIATLPDGDIAVRNSRDPRGPALVYTPDEIRAFVQGAKTGDFDALLK